MLQRFDTTLCKGQSSWRWTWRLEEEEEEEEEEEKKKIIGWTDLELHESDKQGPTSFHCTQTILT